MGNTSNARRVSANSRYSTGDSYDGHRRGYTSGTTVRASEHLNVSGNVAFNGIALPGGAFTTTLLTGRLNCALSTKSFLNALVQYNTDARQWSSNERFNIIHRPLSDIYLVYNERRSSQTGEMLDRAIVAKMTCMVAFWRRGGRQRTSRAALRARCRTTSRRRCPGASTATPSSRCRGRAESRARRRAPARRHES
jgi:hypothetical protein